MEKLTLKEYAVKHKLSIFNVMKMAKTGKVKSKTQEENGKEVTYILLDEKREEEIKNAIIPLDEKEEGDLKEAVRILRKEVTVLKEEIEVLKKAIL